MFQLYFYLCFGLDEIFQVFIKHSLKIMIFSNDFLKVPLYCDFFVAYAVLLA
jgi:hypothetical protein